MNLLIRTINIQKESKYFKIKNLGEYYELYIQSDGAIVS